MELGRRLIVTFLLFLLAGLSTYAGPISWVKRQVEEHPVRTRIVTSVPVHLLLARGMYLCRVPNVENCQEHYGSAWGGYATDVGLDAVMQIVGYKIGGKVGDVISYGSTTTELGWAAYQWHGGLNKPSENKDASSITSKPDFSSTVIVRR